MPDFYDQLAPFYHLIFDDWHASVRRQGDQLGQLIRAEWPACHKVLDVSCGIGTQAIGLALQGFSVRASDSSQKSIERAVAEARALALDIAYSVCDLRGAEQHHGSGFDLVIACDNSLAHLLSDQDLLAGLRQMHACLGPGAGVLVTLRDYEREPRGSNLVKLHGARTECGKRTLLFQVWDFDSDDHYQLSMYVIEEDLASGAVHSQVLHSRAYAITTRHLGHLMEQAGFGEVRRIDGAFYQPVVIGTKL